MTSARFLALFSLLMGAGVMAAAPQLYRQAAYESPVRGDPDDLLLLAGYGFAADDIVVYRAIADTAGAPAVPRYVPERSGPDIGLAPIVSAADVPYSLTIKLPQTMRPNQAYALWVRTSRGEWSDAVKINDARPLWFSPSYVYASQTPGFLPRELKIVGRNLQSNSRDSTQIRLIGPQKFTGPALSDVRSSEALNPYAARVRLPAQLAPGLYRVQLSRDGAGWVEVRDQTFEVLPDPRPAPEFSVSDPQFGGCRADDGADDTLCILRAIDAAARAGGGAVTFAPGTWDLIDSTQEGLVSGEGIVVPAGVKLRGAGSALTRLHRHPQWNVHRATAAFTLIGHTVVTGFTFRDLQVYQPADHAGPFLQVGEDWQLVANSRVSADAAAVSDVTISRNLFDKPEVAIASGGLPIKRMVITYNIFGAYGSALELSGDQFNVIYKYRLEDAVIDYNVFKPGSKLDLIQKTGTLASELGAGHRVDFSGNTADGTATDYLYAPEDAKGWRAAFFWNPNNNVEEVLVSQNSATCTGDKIGDGEAIAFDNNTNTFGFATAPTVLQASADSIGVSEPLAARQHHLEVPMADYYVGHWVQIVSGPGLGQARKITGYSTDSITHVTTFRVAPDWDVVPIPGQTRMTIGREYWQVYVVDNYIDNRQPLCQKSNRTRNAAGSIIFWAQSADSVIAGNRQYDSDGIFVQQNYVTPEHPCADCTMEGYFHSFLDIRDNLVDGEYDWATDCSASGIIAGVAAAPWEDGAPPTVGFGVSISHNTIRRADGLYGGAVGQVSSWWGGPKPNRWPLSDNMLIHHNSMAQIDGPRALPICGKSRPRIGIAFPDAGIAWRTVIYANSCHGVSMPLGGGGVDVVKVCPSSAADSCECPAAE